MKPVLLIIALLTLPRYLFTYSYSQNTLNLNVTAANDFKGSPSPYLGPSFKLFLPIPLKHAMPRL